ncbi:C40 family peptidase [uncultured Thomasclavelia sp.]|uniref:C40 family peptidase n=1 Tax=uncultured Thomasclavelia sp. TaxID=3025759 RepID=UPI0025912C5A|nr:NlpC/P60 family protein [uncultured Thomasclavelia sp.]
MWTKITKLMLMLLSDKNNAIKKFFKSLLIIIISPFVALTLLVGAIFSDGISFNHNLITDLFNGNPVTDFIGEQAVFIKEIQDGLLKIDASMDETNELFTSGATLNEYQVKGYFIGLMFSSQRMKFDESKADGWVNSFVKEEEETKSPTSVNSTIYSQMESNFSIELLNDTKELMETTYAGLIGNDGGTVTTLSDEEIKALIDNLPKDTSDLRKNIVIQGADAVGKIPYYWGGSASVKGYEGNDFGKIIEPDEKGRNRKGLDCSHFVDWVYWTVMDNNLGNTNTTGQIKLCKKIEINELLAGDLAFLMDKNGKTTHVGIYAGMNKDGERVWIHENANDNNVAVNTVSYWSGYYRLKFMEGR